jgi:hypothetical protein
VTTTLQLAAVPGGWTTKAACAGAPDLFFGHDRGARHDAASRICESCPVFDRCRDYIDQVEEGIPFGSWFGLFAGETPRERWRRRRRG